MGKKRQLITDKGYYLGQDANGYKVYLEKPSWDCDWYWGFGYISGFKRTIMYYFTHWNCLLDMISEEEQKEMTSKSSYDIFKKFIPNSTLSENSIWVLADFMNSYYTLSNMAELFYLGGSHYTEKAKQRINFADEALYNHIVKELMPKLFEEIDKLFIEEEKGE